MKLQTAATLPLLFIASLRGASATSKCGGHIDTHKEPWGILHTPGYPDQYPPDINCTWIIKAPEGQKIRLEFGDFDITGSEGCTGDYVGITHNYSETKRSMENRYCGTQLPDVVTSDDGVLVIRFFSNSLGSCRGFNATYSVLEEKLSCGDSTNSMEFMFQSPEYPKEVGNSSLECSLEVEHSCEVDICQLRLDFEEFSIQPPFWGDCLHDQFYAEGATALPTLCGSNNGTHMYVNVEGRRKTDLTFMLKELEYYMYNCFDLYAANEEGYIIGENPWQTPHLRSRRDLNRDQPSSINAPTETTFKFPFMVKDSTTTYKRQNENDFLAFTKTGKIPFQNIRFPSVNHINDDRNKGGNVRQDSSTSPPLRQLQPTVALFQYKDAEMFSFPTRRAWKVHVTQIPCECPQSRVPKAPTGCLQYYEGLTGQIKSFNFDGYSCYVEDSWCDLEAMTHFRDCNIRVGHTGHLNNLDYSICIEPESGFCGIQYQQLGKEGFSVSNITDPQDEDLLQHASVGDKSCIADYVWFPGAESDRGGDTHERHCGNQLGNARKWGTVTSYSKPFVVRMVTDADERTHTHDYMNQGFHLSYSQIPCKLSG